MRNNAKSRPIHRPLPVVDQRSRHLGTGLLPVTSLEGHRPVKEEGHHIVIEEGHRLVKEKGHRLIIGEGLYQDADHPLVTLFHPKMLILTGIETIVILHLAPKRKVVGGAFTIMTLLIALLKHGTFILVVSKATHLHFVINFERRKINRTLSVSGASWFGRMSHQTLCQFNWKLTVKSSPLKLIKVQVEL